MQSILPRDNAPVGQTFAQEDLLNFSIENMSLILKREAEKYGIYFKHSSFGGHPCWRYSTARKKRTVLLFLTISRYLQTVFMGAGQSADACSG